MAKWSDRDIIFDNSTVATDEVGSIPFAEKCVNILQIRARLVMDAQSLCIIDFA